MNQFFFFTPTDTEIWVPLVWVLGKPKGWESESVLPSPCSMGQKQSFTRRIVIVYDVWCYDAGIQSAATLGETRKYGTWRWMDGKSKRSKLDYNRGRELLLQSAKHLSRI